MHPILKYGLYTVIAGVSLEAVLKLIRSIQNRKIQISEVLFTNNRSSCCLRPNPNCKNPYCMDILLDHIVKHIDEAKSIMCIAIYIFTCKKLFDAVLRAHKRGVVIRMIVEKSMYHSTESKVRQLENAGIPVRKLKSENPHTLMHHKFCVIDVFTNETKFKENLHPSNGLVMSGSMNWTISAFCGNWENIIITSDTEIKEKFKCEFDSMWYDLGQQFTNE